MPKLQCRCGEILNLSPIPNPLGFTIMSEARMDEAANALIEGQQRHDDFPDTVMQILHNTRGAVHAYECPRCGRWAILRRASDPEVMLWLQPEDAATAPRIAPVINLES
jgi:predicted RNA-binding Zn-ribbon protein involved in translation (DUF1610 family)